MRHETHIINILFWW